MSWASAPRGEEVTHAVHVGRPVEELWELVRSPRGVAIWLGRGARIPDAPGGRYRTREGVTGQLLSEDPGAYLRLTRREPDVDHHTVVDLAVLAEGHRSVLRCREWGIRSPEERSRRRAAWFVNVERLLAPEGPAPRRRLLRPWRPSSRW